MEIGRAYCDWHWRNTFKPPISTGQKQRKTLAQQRNAENVRKKKAVKEKRGCIEKLLPQATLRSGGALEIFIKRRLPSEPGEGVSRRTIRRDLQHIRGKP